MDEKRSETRQERARRKCSQWLLDNECNVSEYDGEPFVIVERYETTKVHAFEDIVEKATGIRYNWGFSDEYTTCCDCGNIIRTAPDGYGWQADFWVNYNWGVIICKDCVRNNYESEYLKDKVNHKMRPIKVINTDIVHPEDCGFKHILCNCKYGMHPGQNEDPRTVAKWAEENGLDVAFDIAPSQFDTSWGAWMRKKKDDDDDCEFDTYTDDIVLTDDEVEVIREGMVATSCGYGYQQRDSLKAEFRQWPAPDKVIQEQLKQVDEMGARFATVGMEGGPVVYGSLEEMVDAKRKE